MSSACAAARETLRASRPLWCPAPAMEMATALFVKRKVLAYVTRGDELLVFRHRDFPEAGLQVREPLRRGKTQSRRCYGRCGRRAA